MRATWVSAVVAARRRRFGSYRDTTTPLYLQERRARLARRCVAPRSTTIRTLRERPGAALPPAAPTMPATTGDAGATATPRAEGPRPASPPRHRVPVWCDWLALAAIVALFVGVAAYQIRLPGLYNDEAYDVVPAMQLVLGQPVELNRGVGLRLFGRDLPLMISDYQGATSAYGVLPLFALFGVGVETVRAFTIGVGALAIVLTYLFGRALFGR